MMPIPRVPPKPPLSARERSLIRYRMQRRVIARLRAKAAQDEQFTCRHGRVVATHTAQGAWIGRVCALCEAGH